MRTSLTLFLLCLAFGIYAQTLGGSYPQPIRNSDTAVIKHVDWVQDPEILPDSTLEQLMRDIQAYKEPEMKNVSTAISPLYHRSYFGQSFRLDDLRGPYRIAERTRRMRSGNFIMLYTIQR